MEKEKKLTKKNIQGIYEAKMRNALCYVERTKDTESFYTNGITVYVNSQWAVVSRMYIRTVYSNETSNYALLRLILDLYKKNEAYLKMSDEEKANIKALSEEERFALEMTKEEEDALQNGKLWVQSLIISDSYSDFELSMQHLVEYLEFFENKLTEANVIENSDKIVLAKMSQDEMIKEQLK